jgi:hypothetical protein
MFGEMEIMTTKKKIQGGKLKDCITVCIFVGFTPNHACDVLRSCLTTKEQRMKRRYKVALKKLRFTKD